MVAPYRFEPSGLKAIVLPSRLPCEYMVSSRSSRFSPNLAEGPCISPVGAAQYTFGLPTPASLLPSGQAASPFFQNSASGAAVLTGAVDASTGGVTGG